MLLAGDIQTVYTIHTMSEEKKLSSVSEDESTDTMCNKTHKSLVRRLSSSQDLSKEELIRKLQEYRKANIELLEDKRHLLLRSQEAYKIETELDQTKDELFELKKRVKALESSPQNSVEELASNTIKELVRQLSNNTQRKVNEEPQQFDFKDCEAKCADKEEIVYKKERREDLHLPLNSNMDEGNNVCHCGAAEKLSEVIKVNHFWQKDYTALLEDFNNVKARLWKAESQVRILQNEKEDLVHNTICRTCEEVNRSVKEEELKDAQKFTLDDIEALKQQLIIYKEDYLQEKEDCKKLLEDQNKLKLELQKAYGIIDNLTLKNTRIKQNYHRVSTEKEHIITELRRLSTSSLPFSPVNVDQRFPRVGSLETVHSEDIIPHSVPSIHIPGTFYGGHVVRDGGHTVCDGGHIMRDDYVEQIEQNENSCRKRTVGSSNSDSM